MTWSKPYPAALPCSRAVNSAASMPVMRNGGLYTSEPRVPLVSWVLGAPMSEPPQAASTNAAPKPNPSKQPPHKPVSFYWVPQHHRCELEKMLRGAVVYLSMDKYRYLKIICVSDQHPLSIGVVA